MKSLIFVFCASKHNRTENKIKEFVSKRNMNSVSLSRLRIRYMKILD